MSIGQTAAKANAVHPFGSYDATGRHKLIKVMIISLLFLIRVNTYVFFLNSHTA